MRWYFRHIVWLLRMHLTLLLALSVCRLALYGVSSAYMDPSSQGAWLLQGRAFLNGIWFDNVMVCMVSLLPLIFMTITDILNVFPRWRWRLIWSWYSVFGVLLVGISLADIPYFLYFLKHINSSIWNWVSYGNTTFGMILGERSFYPAILGWLILSLLMIWSLRPTRFLRDDRPPLMSWTPRLLIFFVGSMLTGLCVFGIRGRTGYNPIKVSAAYYCQDSYLNQLGVNPAFNLLLTTLDDRRPENRRLRLMPLKEAKRLAEASLAEEKRRLKRPVPPTSKPNVCLIFMESMSAELMHRGHTPFLDSLEAQSLHFTRCYSAGNHTNHGVFSTLYSYPALMYRNLMKGTNIPHYEGLPHALKKQGYSTLFFMTHEAQYDNMNAFLRTNGYDEIFSQGDYPRDSVVNSFGVSDLYLYHFVLKQLASRPEPWFSSVLSISNHPPYIIPEWFEARSSEPAEQILEYADFSLRSFFEEASRQPWYDETIFVLLGDHGKLTDEARGEMPQCLNHIPLLIYRPQVEGRREDSFCMQLDVQSILLSILGYPDETDHFGQDVLHFPRTMAYYTADNVIGARDSSRLYVYEPGTSLDWCYDTDREGKILHVSRDSKRFTPLKKHLFSMIQWAQYRILQHE